MRHFLVLSFLTLKIAPGGALGLASWEKPQALEPLGQAIDPDVPKA